MYSLFDQPPRRLNILFWSKRAFCGFLLNVLALFACQSAGEKSDKNDQNLTRPFLPSAQTEIRYASGFSLAYHNAYKVLKVFPQGSGDTLVYGLLPKGVPVPPELSEVRIVRIPVERMVVLSTSHVGFAAFADALDRIVGLESHHYIYHPALLKRIAEGQVQEVGAGGSLNLEAVLALQPDLVMVSGMGADYLRPYRVLEESGIPVVVNVEWTDQTALGRAEWCKLMAALLNEEEKVNERFAEVERNYLAIKEKAQSAVQKPEVVIGLPFKDAWFVPGKKSYVGDLLRDAGATWAWAEDTSAVSLGLNLEQVYPAGVRAPIWIAPGAVHTLAEIVAVDARLADFQSINNKKVFNTNARMSPNGLGNDYWESGVVAPDEILADLLSILHPELLPDRKWKYMKRVE